MGKAEIVSLVLLVIVTYAGSISVAQEEQWLSYRSDRDVSRYVGPVGTQRLRLNVNKPQGVELPPFTSERPMFGQWKTPIVESGYLWVALDRTDRHGQYDRLFIDSNGDGHLKDETAEVPYEIGPKKACFGPVKVVYAGEDGPAILPIL